jgi:NTP pyrophosphatase (non-canonical NTP hydrolase)
MDFSEYQKLSRETAIYPNLGGNLAYPTLGLCGESGEVAEKIKKMYRDDNGLLTENRRTELKKELGDVLWYVSNVAVEAGLSLDDIAFENIQKLHKRKEENKLHGSGDNR